MRAGCITARTGRTLLSLLCSACSAVCDENASAVPFWTLAGACQRHGVGGFLCVIQQQQPCGGALVGGIRVLQPHATNDAPCHFFTSNMKSINEIRSGAGRGGRSFEVGAVYLGWRLTKTKRTAKAENPGMPARALNRARANKAQVRKEEERSTHDRET